jgi:hypothetical protein
MPEFLELAKAAGGYVTAVSIVALAILMFAYITQRSKIVSLRAAVVGDAPISPDDVVRILKTFGSDDTRLRALETIVQNDSRIASEVLSRAKNVKLDQKEQASHRLVYALAIGVLFLAFGGIGIVARHQDAAAPVAGHVPDAGAQHEAGAIVDAAGPSIVSHPGGASDVVPSIKSTHKGDSETRVQDRQPQPGIDCDALRDESTDLAKDVDAKCTLTNTPDITACKTRKADALRRRRRVNEQMKQEHCPS